MIDTVKHKQIINKNNEHLIKTNITLFVGNLYEGILTINHIL